MPTNTPVWLPRASAGRCRRVPVPPRPPRAGGAAGGPSPGPRGLMPKKPRRSSAASAGTRRRTQVVPGGPDRDRRVVRCPTRGPRGSRKPRHAPSRPAATIPPASAPRRGTGSSSRRSRSAPAAPRSAGDCAAAAFGLLQGFAQFFDHSRQQDRVRRACSSQSPFVRHITSRCFLAEGERARLRAAILSMSSAVPLWCEREGLLVVVGDLEQRVHQGRGGHPGYSGLEPVPPGRQPGAACIRRRSALAGGRRGHWGSGGRR